MGLSETLKKFHSEVLPSPLVKRFFSIWISGALPEPAVVSAGRLDYRRFMTAAKALDKQIERYREMTGEQRLAVALDLHEMSCDIAREGIRHQHPSAKADEVERLLRRRLELSRGA